MNTELHVSASHEVEEAILHLPGRAADASREHVTIRAPDYFPESRATGRLEAQGADLLVHIPREFATMFEANASYQLEIPELQIVGDVFDWPVLRARPIVVEPRPVILPKKITTKPTSEEDEMIHSEIPVGPPEKKTERKHLVPVLGGGVIGLGILGFLAFYLLHHPTLPGQDKVASSRSPIAAPLNATAPDSDPFANKSVPDVIREAGTAVQIRQEGETRLKNGKTDDGVLLLEAAADRGDTPAMNHLGHLYDPTTFDPKGPIPSPDVRESAHYYQSAAKAGDTSSAQDRARLHTALQQQSANDDMTAQLALKDFWP
ncbi:sel1 repeat family protein [Gluconobacter sp. LMG 1744]|uniref:sel1 repeat family protein n=1 Tax=Gluconobacter TaxID=441 RepID=UPI00098AE10F|nr:MULTISPECIES: sel1 repeat family protein [Gluconobacter]AQS92414.1 hypothetical protein A0U94_14680 [Gluconobacter albidus]MBF0891856.1 sel1 repeat family protein [Gluconobacter cadivus]MBS1092469.1 sel1 repeat family protein [Gluconobacter sp. Dm-74]